MKGFCFEEELCTGFRKDDYGDYWARGFKEIASHLLAQGSGSEGSLRFLWLEARRAHGFRGLPDGALSLGMLASGIRNPRKSPGCSKSVHGPKHFISVIQQAECQQTGRVITWYCFESYFSHGSPVPGCHRCSLDMN